MTFADHEPRDFHRFLDKFRILDEIRWTEDLIDRSVAAVAQQLAVEQIDYAWMDFSINKYMGIGWHKHEAVKFIYDAFQRYRPGGVGLILSIKYESMQASQRQYARLIEHEVAADCLIGLDVVGDEAYFNAQFYRPLFRGWTNAKKITRAHVGESQEAANIRAAIEVLEASNLAHGFKVLEDEYLIDLARERGVTFDLALISNDITGVWSLQQVHPIVAMCRAALRCTLGSDDPVQCSTTLQQQFDVARQHGLTELECHQLRLTAQENSEPFLHFSQVGFNGG